MPSVQVIKGQTNSAARAALVFGGDLVVFKAVEPLFPFLAWSDAFIRGAFVPHHPLKAHALLERDAYAAKIEQLRKDFRSHAEARALFQAVLTHLGLDPKVTGWDWLHLRIQPPAAGLGLVNTLGAHRDTWVSNVYEQVNWWTPLYPVTAERAVVFYLAYWSRPLANTSEDWDLEEIIARRKRATDAIARSSVIPTPVPSEPIDVSSELRVVIEPGDMLCFSGAHLHASVPNTSALTRFNVEVRTVSVDDLRLGRRAPNVDGHAPGRQIQWFRRLSDGASLMTL